MMTPDDEKAPPAGGFGAPAAGQTTELVHHAAKPKRPSSLLHVLFIAAGSLVAVMLLSASFYEWYRDKAARRGEAHMALRMTALGLQEAYAQRHELCPSARPVPADFEAVRGKRYTSTPREWHDDPGWACAGFEAPYPQRYQYRFETASVFVTITAAGDLDGDDVRATYTLRGHTDPKTDTLVFDPSIEDSNDGE